MSFLNGTHTTTVTTVLPPETTLPQVLSLLHDHSAMISMNPLVISHRRLRPNRSITRSRSSSSSTASSVSSSASSLYDKPLPPPPTYEVVDSLDTSLDESDTKNGAGSVGWAARLTQKLSPATVTYTAQMQSVPEGLDIVIDAPMGIRNCNTWRVREDPLDGTMVLEERSEMSANRLVIGFVSRTAKESHEKLVDRFIERLEVVGKRGEKDKW